MFQTQSETHIPLPLKLLEGGREDNFSGLDEAQRGKNLFRVTQRVGSGAMENLGVLAPGLTAESGLSWLQGMG